MEEQKEKSLKTYQTISIILFIISVILLINLVLALHTNGNIHNFAFILLIVAFIVLDVSSFILFLPILILYFLCSAIYVYFKFKKIPYINIIAIALICTFYILYYTGFCFSQMKYWSKAEIIDTMLNSYIKENCYEEYKIKHGTTIDMYKNATKECSITLESVKKEAPQCFKTFRKDSCKGNITHFDEETNSFIKSEIEVYRYGKISSHSSPNSEYLRFYVESGLNLNANDNDPIIGCCGTMQGSGMWD